MCVCVHVLPDYSSVCTVYGFIVIETVSYYHYSTSSGHIVWISPNVEQSCRFPGRAMAHRLPGQRGVVIYCWVKWWTGVMQLI